MSVEEMWDYLLEVIGVSKETLVIITDIYGYNKEVMENVLYAVTGYRSFDQLEEEAV